MIKRCDCKDKKEFEITYKIIKNCDNCRKNFKGDQYKHKKKIEKNEKMEAI